MYSSAINNKTLFGSVGATGFTGPTGNIGPTGNPGSTGNTGAAGVYVTNSTTNNTQILFTLSNGQQLGITGSFRGNTGYGNTQIPESVGDGISIIGSSSEGQLNIKGISGTGSLVVSTTDNNVSINTIYTSTVGNVYSVGLSADTLMYLKENDLASSTRVKMDGTGDLNFQNQFYLNDSAYIRQVGPVKKNQYVGITGAIDNFTEGTTGGIYIDLENGGFYLIRTPIGIVGFTGSFRQNEILSATLIIESDEIWKFPENVYFEEGENYFTCGKSIVNISTFDAGNNWYATVSQRGLDIEQIVACKPSFGRGSCCYTKYPENTKFCLDYVTKDECQALSGEFNSLLPCAVSCVSDQGLCCSNGNCLENVSVDECNFFGGNYYSGINCQTYPNDPNGLNYGEPIEAGRLCYNACEGEKIACCKNGVCLGNNYSRIQCELILGGKSFTGGDCSSTNCCENNVGVGACCICNPANPGTAPTECIPDVTKEECKKRAKQLNPSYVGVFMGEGERCGDINCDCACVVDIVPPVGTGAACLTTGCIDGITEQDARNLGVPFYPNISCYPELCGNNGVTGSTGDTGDTGSTGDTGDGNPSDVGAVCITGQCVDNVTREAAGAQGLTFYKDATCFPTFCEEREGGGEGGGPDDGGGPGGGGGGGGGGPDPTDPTPGDGKHICPRCNYTGWGGTIRKTPPLDGVGDGDTTDTTKYTNRCCYRHNNPYAFDDATKQFTDPCGQKIVPPWKTDVLLPNEKEGAQFSTFPNCGAGGCPDFSDVLCRMDCFDAIIRAAVCCKVKKAYDDGDSTTQLEICGVECPDSTGVGVGDCTSRLSNASQNANCPFDPEFLADPCKFFKNLPDDFWKAFEGTKGTPWSMFECICPKKSGPQKCGPIICGLFDYGISDPCFNKNGPNAPKVGPGKDVTPGLPKGGDWENTGGGIGCKGGNINGTGGGKGQGGGNIDYGKCCGNPQNGGILTDNVPGDSNPNNNNGGFCRSNGDCGAFCQGDTVCMFMKDPCFEEFMKDWDKTDPNDQTTPRPPIVYPGGGDQSDPKKNPPIWHVKGCPACAPNGWTPGSSWPDWKQFDPLNPFNPLPVTTEPGRMTISCNGEFGGGTKDITAPLTAPPLDTTISYVKVFNSDGTHDCIPLIFDISISDYELC